MAPSCSGGGVAVVTVTLVCLLLVSTAPHATKGLTCGEVASSLSPCLAYGRGVGPLTSQCCSGVRSLVAMAKTTADRRAACSCMKSTADAIPGLKPQLLAGVPSKCGVKLRYAISTRTNCSKVV